MNSWQERARQDLKDITLSFDCPMAQLTTFKIGGPLDLLVEVADLAQLRQVLEFCRREGLPWLLLGLGSNLLVRDKGIRGLGIRLGGKLARWEVDATRVRAGAGAVLAELVQATAAAGLAGLEFGCGIPGTVGGAIFMNAGAYDGEIAQVLSAVTVWEPQTGQQTYPAAELELGYRTSRFQREPQTIILEAEFQLQPAPAAELADRIHDLTCRRVSKQPVQLPCAGSVFRRPEGYYVGPLLEGAGLKGLASGGAQVSPQHAGFIVNTGGATAQDVLDLIARVQAEIKSQHGIQLVPEIRVIGEI